jgi:hypothetical protein
MSLRQIFDFVERTDALSKEGCHMKKDVEVLKIVDDYFVSFAYTDSEQSNCICGCIENTRFLDLIDLPDDYFKVILEYCIDKKYIINNADFEYQLCRKLIRIHCENYNIRIILWLIENYISTERLNSFRFDYNYDTDEILEKKETEKYPQEFYSLFQPFYNNQLYDDTFIPMIFATFRNKGFDFKSVSKTCSRSLIVSALSNWDLYSVRELHLEGCEFDEECYSRLMGMLRRSIGNLRDEAEKVKQPREYSDGSWSYVDCILYRQLLKEPEMIKLIFQPHLLRHDGDDEDEENQKLVKMIESYIDDKLMYLPNLNKMKKYMIEKVSSYHYRRYLVPNEIRMSYVYDIIKYCVEEIKIDLNHECFAEQQEDSHIEQYQIVHPTLLNGYLYGSLPIELIFPEYHMKFIEILTP